MPSGSEAGDMAAGADTADGTQPVYTFSPKFRWQIKNHFLSGITMWAWLKLICRHIRHIDWHLYWHRVLFLSFMSIANTFLAIPDWLLYRRRIANQPLHPEPLFVIGHPRTGTTHLHNLLSLDPAFAFCSTFQAGFPSSFLCLSPLRYLLSPLLDETRPMDNMAMSWELPAEDEIAATTLSGGTSPYMACVLPREHAANFSRLFTFGTGAAERSCSARDGGDGSDAAPSLPPPPPPGALAEWRRCFLWLLRKLTLSASLADGPGAGPRPLLLKSPVHAARVELMRQLFPRARFVYIHRHPLQVFQSAAHLADWYYWYSYLQAPTNEVTTEFILSQYEKLYDEYIASRGNIPEGRLHELAFDELADDPIAALRSIYGQFGWMDRFESLLPKFEAYCFSICEYKRNNFSRLTPGMVAEVRRRWAPSFQEFGYS